MSTAQQDTKYSLDMHPQNIKVVFVRGETLNMQEAVDFVKSPKCGAINVFMGTIRDSDLKKTSCTRPIQAIIYESYQSMATKQIVAIIDSVVNNSGREYYDMDANSRAYVAMRLGSVPVEDTAIIIGVSSTKRDFCHEATMAILDRVKTEAAVWKKIVFKDYTEDWADEVRQVASTSNGVLNC